MLYIAAIINRIGVAAAKACTTRTRAAAVHLVEKGQRGYQSITNNKHSCAAKGGGVGGGGGAHLSLPMTAVPSAGGGAWQRP
jgi:hypothetical protein